MQPLFDAFGDDVISYTTERLETDNIFHSVAIESGNIGWQKPTFTELSGKRNNIFDTLGFMIDVGERTEIAEAGTGAIKLFLSALDEFVECADNEIGHIRITQT